MGSGQNTAVLSLFRLFKLLNVSERDRGCALQYLRRFSWMSWNFSSMTMSSMHPIIESKDPSSPSPTSSAKISSSSSSIWNTFGSYIYRLLSISKHYPSIGEISSYLSSTAICCYCCGKRMLHANFSDHELVNI